MNAWIQISRSEMAAGLVPADLRVRRLRLLAIGGIAFAATVALVAETTGSPTSAAPAQSPASDPSATAAGVLASLPAQHRVPAPVESGSIRFTGAVGPDLTRSLQAAGVPERQGREYVATIAKAIGPNGGLSVEDRFDLVILGKRGTLGALAYAGLDRVGRSDVELMKWTDGRETRWIDADGVDQSAQGMAMPVAGRLSSGFGERFHPILGYRRMHSGVDLAAPYGTPIVAAADGRVTAAGWRGGYGNEVSLAHSGGIETIYGHMSSIAVSAGGWVRRGQVIGRVGSTGLSTGPHLHYEVHLNGKRVNPLSVKMTESPLKGEELHAFKSRLRGLLTGRGGV